MQSAFTTKLLCAAAFTCLVSVAQADTITNLGDLAGGTGTVYASGPPQSYAQEFTTDTGGTLSDVIAVLGDASGIFTATASLETNSVDLPSGTVLTTFTVPSIPTGSPADVTFTPNASITLSADTSYWFVLAATGTTGSYEWDYTNTTQANLPNYAVNDGAGWSIGAPPGPFLIEVVATPEPSSLLLSATAIFGLFVARIRKNR
jgi:hypothetical protein